jgi:4a-hydroxytetrahydrobiopterin dehydratase
MATKMTASEIGTALKNVAGWQADGESSIAKAFKFGDHIEAMGFVNRVALAAEKMDHHPELTIVYNNVSIRLNTTWAACRRRISNWRRLSRSTGSSPPAGAGGDDPSAFRPCHSSREEKVVRIRFGALAASGPAGQRRCP